MRQFILEADLFKTVEWVERNGLRWVFTLSNAGSYYFEDRNDLSRLYELNWEAIHATYWQERSIKEAKQAEFLVEHRFPWELVERIGVRSENMYSQVESQLASVSHSPRLQVMNDWYY